MTAGVEDEPADGSAAPVRDDAGRDGPARHGSVSDPVADHRADPLVITGSGPAAAQDSAGRPRAPITVEQAYRAKLRAAAAQPPEPAAADAPHGSSAAATSSPPDSGESREPLPPGPEPSPSRPGTCPHGPEGQPAPPVASGVPSARRTPVAPPPHLRARPRIEPEQGILGLSRHTRSRLGSRLFNLFFVCVFALILVQMVVALLTP